MFRLLGVPSDPVDSLQLALAIEVAVLPPYLYACCSNPASRPALRQCRSTMRMAEPSAGLVRGLTRVFDRVFRTYFLTYPVTRFLRGPLQFWVWRVRITELTDQRLFETARHMPVTWSLSAGQRQILQPWNSRLDGPIASRQPRVGSGAGRA